MSDLEYEPTNKVLLEECCKIMNKGVAAKEFKTRKLVNRRRIEDILDIRELSADDNYLNNLVSD